MSQILDLDKMGPYRAWPTSYAHKHFFIAGSISTVQSSSTEWRMSPQDVGDPGGIGVFAHKLHEEKLAQGDLHGRFSPVAGLTLPPQVRDQIFIPNVATMYAFSYPVSNYKFPQDLQDISEEQVLAIPEFSFFARGGFVYFDSDAKIVQVNALMEDPAGKLLFGKSRPWSHEFTSSIPTDRFQKVKPHDMGRDAEHFCWIKPGEVLPGCGVPSPHGGFAVLAGRPRNEGNPTVLAKFFPVSREGYADAEFDFEEDPTHWLPSWTKNAEVVSLVKENAKAGGVHVPLGAVSGPPLQKAQWSCWVLWMFWLLTPLLRYFAFFNHHWLFYAVMLFCSWCEWTCLTYVILIQVNVTGAFDLIPKSLVEFYQEDCACISKMVAKVRLSRMQRVYSQDSPESLEPCYAKLHLGYILWLSMQTLWGLIGKLSILCNALFAAKRFWPTASEMAREANMEEIWQFTIKQSFLSYVLPECVLHFWVLSLVFWVGMCFQFVWTLLYCWPIGATPDHKMATCQELHTPSRDLKYKTYYDDNQNFGTALQLYAVASRMASVTYRDFTYAKSKMALALERKRRGIQGKHMDSYFHAACHQIQQGFSAFFFVGFMQSLINMHLQISHMGMETVMASTVNDDINVQEAMSILSTLVPITLNWIVLFAKLVQAKNIWNLYRDVHREIERDGEWYKGRAPAPPSQDALSQPLMQDDIESRVFRGEDQTVHSAEPPPDRKKWEALQRHFAVFIAALSVYFVFLVIAAVKCFGLFACEHHLINIPTGCVNMHGLELKNVSHTL